MPLHTSAVNIRCLAAVNICDSGGPAPTLSNVMRSWGNAGRPQREHCQAMSVVTPPLALVVQNEAEKVLMHHFMENGRGAVLGEALGAVGIVRLLPESRADQYAVRTQCTRKGVDVRALILGIVRL
jgi:hypothetical protein